LTVFEAGVAAQHITPSSFDAIRMGGPRVPFVRGSAGRSRSFAPAKADGKLSAKVSSASERIRESRRREESVDDALSACPAMIGWPQRNGNRPFGGFPRMSRYGRTRPTTAGHIRTPSTAACEVTTAVHVFEPVGNFSAGNRRVVERTTALTLK
jgi:hypothetical protein